MQTNPLGNFPIDKFLSEYWQKKPLFIRDALPNITSPVSAEVLAGLACEEEVESRIIIQHQNDSKWDLLHGPFQEETFAKLPESHWTLLVQAVDHWVPEAAKFLNQFNFIPRWRIDDLMISYASDNGGVGPHYDNYDVFLVQTDGKRKWEIGEQYDESSTLIENVPVSILSEFKAIDSWILEPGDILYVPPGYGHNGIAVGDDCITCSIGFRAPSHTEILREYTDHISENISDAMRYNDANLVEQINTGEISKQALDKVQKILQEYLNDTASVSDWFGRYITTPKYSQVDERMRGASNTDNPSSNIYSSEHVDKHLKASGCFFRNESSRFAYISTEGTHKLFVDGECISTLEDTNPLIETLCSEIEYKSDMFSHTDNNMKLLAELLQLGALYYPEA